ncbi:MAG: nucleotide exchange factor GrpE [Chloroflexaceae bacterium]|nr:nucleotide exchange factor GrpE [Chloroflexaceae bacterium]
MSERSSPLTNRVQRLLHNGSHTAPAAALVAPLHARLIAIERRLMELADRSYAPRPGPSEDQGMVAVKVALAALEKQIGRSGREQLKANSISEAQANQLQAALEALRAAETRREIEVATLREQVATAQTHARLEVVKNILPVLDGLDEAIRSGQQTLEKLQSNPVPPATLYERMLAQKQLQRHSDTPMREALSAWLVGVNFVRQRLLDILGTEGVVPMTTLNQPFNPELHIALEVVPPSADQQPGSVVAEQRRGYMHGTRIIRHAEVTVTGEGM